MYIVAKVLKPQGIKGEVKTKIITSFPQHLAELDVLYLKNEKFEPLKVEARRISGDCAFIKFRSVDDRNQAELLRGKELYITEGELQPLQDDEFYEHQLLGLQAYSEEGALLGQVDSIESYPANDVLVIRDGFGKTKLVPLVKEYVKRVDLSTKKMVIHVVDGLLD